MRQARTYSEVRALNSLKNFLMANGDDVQEVDEITDRPDAVLVINGERIAVEFRIISIEKLLQLHHLRLPVNEPCQVFYPVEPHIWVESAILAKNPKIAEYRTNAGAELAWLVLHSPFEEAPGDVIAIHKRGADILFKAACCRTPHSFDRIYLAGQDGKEAICIFDRSEVGDAEMAELARRRAASVVVESTTFSTIIPEDDGNGGALVVGMQVWMEDQKRFFLGSLDPNIQLDYSSIKGLTPAALFQLSPLDSPLPDAKSAELNAPFKFGVWHRG